MLRLGWQPPAGAVRPLMAEATAIARQADVPVVVVRTYESEEMDRPNLCLPNDQDELIRAVAAANPRTVVVLMNAGPVEVASWEEDVPAVLAAWYAGQEQQGHAVAGGRIIATGQEDYVMRTKTDDTRLVDLEGKTLLPAFIDSHGHFMNAPQIVTWANVSGPPVGPITQIADFIPVLQEHVKKQGLKKGDWIIGYGYDRSNLAEARELEAADLDPYFPDNPVMLIHSSNHGAVLNSAAFAEVGMDETTETPPGGVINRIPGTNKPAGFIMETAFLPIFGNMPQPTEQEMLDILFESQQIYASAGVTTCQEGATHAKDLAFLRKAAEQGLLYLDIVALPMILEVPALVREYAPDFRGGPLELPKEAASAFGTYNNRLKLQGFKFLLDGSPQGKTAFWSEPLLTPGPGGEENWRGQPLFPPELVNKALKEVYDKGVQVFSHCNGDAAIDMMIDGAREAGVKASEGN